MPKCRADSFEIFVRPESIKQKTNLFWVKYWEVVLDFLWNSCDINHKLDQDLLQSKMQFCIGGISTAPPLEWNSYPKYAEEKT